MSCAEWLTYREVKAEFSLRKTAVYALPEDKVRRRTMPGDCTRWCRGDIAEYADCHTSRRADRPAATPAGPLAPPARRQPAARPAGPLVLTPPAALLKADSRSASARRSAP